MPVACSSPNFNGIPSIGQKFGILIFSLFFLLDYIGFLYNNVRNTHLDRFFGCEVFVNAFCENAFDALS